MLSADFLAKAQTRVMQMLNLTDPRHVPTESQLAAARSSYSGDRNGPDAAPMAAQSAANASDTGAAARDTSDGGLSGTVVAALSVVIVVAALCAVVAAAFIIRRRRRNARLRHSEDMLANDVKVAHAAEDPVRHCRVPP